MTEQGSDNGASEAGPEISPDVDPQLEDHATFAHVDDGFQRLWTPHRMAYIVGDKPNDEPGSGCPFCTAPDKSDDEGLIVQRGTHCYVVMNLFPYNPGHLLVCPYRHVSLYVDLTDEETEEFTALTKAAIRALEKASEPHGFNLGMNQGAVAGAGVAAHLHQHIVPIVGQTKALPVLLEDARRRILATWPGQ